MSKASSAFVAPKIIFPSAGKASPGLTSSTSPILRRLTEIFSIVPFTFTRFTIRGIRRISTSSAPAVLSRIFNSIHLPVSRKKTNMVNESKYTSLPSSPEGSNVAAVLTINIIKIPRDTGISILICFVFRSLTALLKKGPHENNMTGNVITQLAHSMRPLILLVISPGIAI